MSASLSNSVLDTPAPQAYDAQWQMTQWNQLPQCSNGAHASGSGENYYNGHMWVPGGPGVAVSTQYSAYYNPPRPVYSAPQNIPQIRVQSSSGNILMNGTTCTTQRRASPLKKKPKRARTAYTTSQINQLEQQFSTNRFLTRTRRMELAKALQLDERKIKVWFQNRRMKEKRDLAELLDGSEALPDSAGMISDMSPSSSSSSGDSQYQDEYVVNGAVLDEGERYQPPTPMARVTLQEVNPEINEFDYLQNPAMTHRINDYETQLNPAHSSSYNVYAMQQEPAGSLNIYDSMHNPDPAMPIQQFLQEYNGLEPINELTEITEAPVFPDTTDGDYSWIRPISEYS